MYEWAGSEILYNIVCIGRCEAIFFWHLQGRILYKLPIDNNFSVVLLVCWNCRHVRIYNSMFSNKILTFLMKATLAAVAACRSCRSCCFPLQPTTVDPSETCSRVKRVVSKLKRVVFKVTNFPNLVFVRL